MRRAVIIDAVRTPIGRYGGALATVRPDDLAALVIKEIVQRTKIDPATIEIAAWDDHPNALGHKLLFLALAHGVVESSRLYESIFATAPPGREERARLAQQSADAAAQTMNSDRFVARPTDGASPSNNIGGRRARATR